MEKGAYLGTAADLQLFKDGVTAFATSLHNMFGGDNLYIGQVGKNFLSDLTTQLDAVRVGATVGELTQIGAFLEKQLAYSVARALE